MDLNTFTTKVQEQIGAYEHPDTIRELLANVSTRVDQGESVDDAIFNAVSATIQTLNRILALIGQ